MEHTINLRAAGDLERKYFLAFLKGLSGIKFRDSFAKVAKSNGEEAPEVIELEFLY